MEKIIYLIWKHPDQSTETFRSHLLGDMSESLISSGVKKLTISIVDDDVKAAQNLRQVNMDPMVDGIVSIWVDSYIYRKKQQTIIEQYVNSLHGYLVTESVPIVNTLHPAKEGKRTHGMSQIAFFGKPETLDRQKWLEIWHNSHTQVAIDTQSTFGYIQNVVVMTLTKNAPKIDAIVEENFPEKAMRCPHTFFDAFDEAGNKDDNKLNEHGETMLSSCIRFIDFTNINVIPASEYQLKSLTT